MIERIWRGWTTPDDADEYERLLRDEIVPEIAAETGDGCRSFRLLRRRLDDEVEFVTIMRFDSIEDVAAFAGEDYENAYVPPSAREVLARFEDRADHYEVRERREYGTE